MKHVKLILISSFALLASSCGLFNSNSVQLPPKATGLQFIGTVDRVERVDGSYTTGNAYSVASRGDTLLVIGNNAVYYVLPGQAMTKLRTTWQYFNSNQNVWDFAYDSTFPGDYAGFVGESDSLYISDRGGNLWKINQIGGPINTYPQQTRGLWSVVNDWAVWTGSVDGSFAVLLGYNGDAFSDTIQAKKDWSRFLKNGSIPNSQPFQIGDTVYFSRTNSDLLAISLRDLGQRTIFPPSPSTWSFIRCDSSICALGSMGVYHLVDGLWHQITLKASVAKALSGVALRTDAVQYRGRTIFQTFETYGNVFGVIHGDTIAARLVQIWPASLDQSHEMSIWKDSLVLTSDDSVYALPMSELLSWK